MHFLLKVQWSTKRSERPIMFPYWIATQPTNAKYVTRKKTRLKSSRRIREVVIAAVTRGTAHNNCWHIVKKIIDIIAVRNPKMAPATISQPISLDLIWPDNHFCSILVDSIAYLLIISNVDGSFASQPK
uniref:Uncharacterized protein n=1 Tax=Opuntia streptacantha TaxID=393608 RepID=A0A7C9EUL3_OPUST